MDPQIRNNAIISYFFLGPIFLLAKAGTPLHHPFVQHHARRASIIMFIGILAFLGLQFVQDLISINIFGINLVTILTMTTLGILVLFLLRGAYQVYGSNSQEITDAPILFDFQENIERISLTESEGVRTSMSFIPLFGIYLASRVNTTAITIGKNVGTIFYFFFTIVVIMTGANSITSLLLLLVYTLCFVGIAVTAVVTRSFFMSSWYAKIPSTLSIGSHIRTLVCMFIELLRVTFGKEKTYTYMSLYGAIHEKRLKQSEYTGTYFLPRWIIGVPVLNILTLRSLFIEEDRENRPLVIQGLVITFFFVLIGYFLSWNIALTLVLIPAVELITGAVRDPYTSAFIVDFFADLYRILSSSKKEFKELAKHSEIVHFHYGIGEEDKTL